MCWAVACLEAKRTAIGEIRYLFIVLGCGHNTKGSKFIKHSCGDENHNYWTIDSPVLGLKVGCEWLENQRLNTKPTY